MKYYPLTEYYPLYSTGKISAMMPGNYKAIITGEFRPPKKGEWYISGAIPEAYYVRNDLSTAFYIAKIVEIKITKTVKYEIIRTLE